MGKTKRNHRREEDDDEARLTALEQKELYGRLPTPPPGHVHDTDRERPGRKRNRRKTRNELQEVVDVFNRS